MCLIYILKARGIDEISRISIKKLLDFCDLEPRSGKHNSNYNIKEALFTLQEEGFIKLNVNIDSCKIGTLVECEVVQEQKEKFFPLYIKDISLISAKNDIDTVALINVYCYILARIKRNKTDIEEKEAETFYDDLELIAFDLGLSKTSLVKYLKQLVDFDLICYGTIGLVKHIRRSKIQMASNCYCLNVEELKKALEGSKQHYLDKHYEILNKEAAIVSKKVDIPNDEEANEVKEPEGDDDPGEKSDGETENENSNLGISSDEDEPKEGLKDDKDRFLDFIFYKYGLEIIPSYILKKIRNINSGNYKDLKSGISYEDMLFLFKRESQNLAEIKSKNIAKGKKLSNDERLNYDLSVIVNRYDDYIKEKNKNKYHDEINDDFIDLLDNVNANIKEHDKDILDDFMKDLF